MKMFCPQCQKTYEGEETDLCPEDGSPMYKVDAEKSEDPLLGAVIDDRFRIEELLGVGGMGAVYKGIQLSVHRKVAIKVLRPELAQREQSLERFFREAKVVSELTHPNIVRLVEFGQDRERDLLYLVMELVQGDNLGDLLKQGRLRANLALEVVYQVCGGLTEPHKQGIVHRDLKPDNLIMLPISDGTLQVKVLDFGIARTLEEGTKLTKTGMICGTPSYMSPEQAQNFELDGRTDLYALGVILFEMLSGRAPYEGDTSLQILLNHIQKPVPRLEAVLPAGTVPEEVADLVNELLSKTPEDRPASARAVRDRIDELRMKLRLKPVRLDKSEGSESSFDAWVLPRIRQDELRISGKARSLADSDMELGVQDSDAESTPRKTEDLVSAPTEALPVRKTKKEFIGVMDTIDSDEVAAVGQDVDEDAPTLVRPTPATEQAAVSDEATVELAEAPARDDKPEETVPHSIYKKPEPESGSKKVGLLIAAAAVVAIVAVAVVFAMGGDSEVDDVGGDDGGAVAVEEPEPAEPPDELDPDDEEMVIADSEEVEEEEVAEAVEEEVEEVEDVAEEREAARVEPERRRVETVEAPEESEGSVEPEESEEVAEAVEEEEVDEDETPLERARRLRREGRTGGTSAGDLLERNRNQ